MLNDHRFFSARPAVARAAKLVLAASVLVFRGPALADPAQGAAGGAPRDAPAKPVTGMQLAVSPNGRYLVDQNGKPFFYLADTCWLLFQRPNHQEVDEYLKDRAAKGFTAIQAYV